MATTPNQTPSERETTGISAGMARLSVNLDRSILHGNTRPAAMHAALQYAVADRPCELAPVQFGALQEQTTSQPFSAAQAMSR
jgi:hypothetical protein